MWLFVFGCFYLTYCCQGLAILYFILFYCWIIFHCMDISHFVYPFIGGWIFALVLVLAIMNNAVISIHVQGFVWAYVFISLGYIPQTRIARSDGSFTEHFEELPNSFPKQLHHFTVPPAAYEGSSLSISSQCMLWSAFHFRHPSGYKVVSHCGFDLHFLND